MRQACGNSECYCSTHITGCFSFGSGRLSHNGEWEFPCRICAKHFDESTGVGRKEKKHIWEMPAWPHQSTDIDNVKSSLQEEFRREDEIWKKDFDEDFYE